MATRRWSSLRSLPTAFVGRQGALAALDEALATSRLVTILGPPGTGKTRLAKEYALSTLGSAWSRPDLPSAPSAIEAGVFFCDLSDSTSPDDLVLRLAQALGIELGAAPANALARVTAALEDGAPALVILDNFEQLVRTSASLVGALYAANEHTRWVVTSRERLVLPGETLFDLGPLALPAEGSHDGEAIELFLERARAVSRPFAPGASELADIAALVRRLDGLPLAIELAAARMRVLSPKEIIERLSERFSLLTRDTSTLGRGSATLWETIDASWALLAPAEQRALGLLSVFRGGFDVPAAESVIEGSGVLDLLQSLRDKSLLLVDESHPFSRRFSLLASIREFASERISPEERAAGELRHAAHYVDLGERLTETLAAGSDPTAAKRIGVEHENVLAVHRRFLEPRSADPTGRAQREPPDACLRAALIVCQSASAFPYSFCLGLLDAAIDRPGDDPLEAGAGDRDRALRLARALEARGNLRRFVGRLEESVDDFERMRSTAEQAGARSLVAAALSGLGNAATVRAAWAEARGFFEQALEIHTQDKDRRAEGRTRAMLAATLFNEDSPAEARKLLDRALELTRASRDRLYEGICITSLGIVTLALGSLAEARTHLGDALRVHREGSVRHWEGVTLAYLAMVEHASGRASEAHELYRRAIDLLHEIDVRRAEGLARFARAGAWLSEAKVADAKAELQRALDLCRAMAPDHEGLVLGALGAVAAIEGDLAASEDLFACAEIALRPFARSSFVAAIEAYRGLLDLARGRDAAERDRQGILKAARDRLAASAAFEDRSFEVRVARRELSRAIDEAAAQPSANDLKRALAVGPSGLWFRAPRQKANVHLHRRKALQLLLHELALHRERAPGEALGIPRLVECGWPQERVLSEAGTERIYTAVSTLRKLGLKGVLLQRDDGYLLDPAVPLVRSASKT